MVIVHLVIPHATVDKQNRFGEGYRLIASKDFPGWALVIPEAWIVEIGDLETSRREAHDRLAHILRTAYRANSRRMREIVDQVPGLNRSTAYNVLNGKVLPAWASVFALAQELGVDPAEIQPLYDIASKRITGRKHRLQANNLEEPK